MKAKNVLITGATGNIGMEVIRYLIGQGADIQITAAVRDVKKSREKFPFPIDKLRFRKFDFEEPASYEDAFRDIDILFLLRPPHISDVEKVFRPLLHAAARHGIGQVVFFSVQGVENNKIIPHHKIEERIKEFGFAYIFVRPGYFMQNLTTALLPEVKKEKSITLPCAKAGFNWIDVNNIGEATAHLLLEFEQYQNGAFDITGTDKKNFYQVAELLSEVTGEKITFKNINPIKFFFKKKKEGINAGLAMVMTLIHFLPRLKKSHPSQTIIKN